MNYLFYQDTTAKPIEEDDEGEEWCEDGEDESLELVEVTTDELMSSSTISSTEFESTASSLVSEDLMLSDSTYETESTSDTTDLYCKLLNFYLKSDKNY